VLLAVSDDDDDDARGRCPPPTFCLCDFLGGRWLDARPLGDGEDASMLDLGLGLDLPRGALTSSSADALPLFNASVSDAELADGNEGACIEGRRTDGSCPRAGS
jgi:hypothetical protein